jgi:hypothetical protein
MLPPFVSSLLQPACLAGFSAASRSFFRPGNGSFVETYKNISSCAVIARIQEYGWLIPELKFWGKAVAAKRKRPFSIFGKRPQKRNGLPIA